ncbi:MAG: hypothetical protein ABSB61_13625 [Anaerolineales bacterium]
MSQGHGDLPGDALDTWEETHPVVPTQQPVPEGDLMKPAATGRYSSQSPLVGPTPSSGAKRRTEVLLAIESSRE